MIEKICNAITNKIRQEMPEVTDERAEAINYGIELIIGELPKIFLLFAVAFVLKIGWLTILAFITMLPYKVAAGGFHLKTHLGCTIGTCLIYCGNVLVSKYTVIQSFEIKLIIALATLIVSIIMISLYAPADTINLPILTKKERKTKKILSYIFMTATLIVAVAIKDNTISNILLLNVIIETVSISRIAFKLTKNEYGYKTYLKQGLIG